MISKYSEAIVRFLERHHYRRVTPHAALIDMDGTLYDSMVNHTAAWHRLISEQGISCTRDEFYLYEGRTGASTINHLFRRAFGRDATQAEVESLYKRKTEYFTELPPVNVMPGAQKMVSELIRMGIKRVLVTGSGQNSLISRIDTDFPDGFPHDKRVTSRDVTHGKPHPEPYIRAMQLARVSPSASIVIENAPLGCEAGNRAGAFTIGVTTGPIPEKELLDAGAAVVFPSMPSLANNLPALILTLMTTSLD